MKKIIFLFISFSIFLCNGMLDPLTAKDTAIYKIIINTSNQITSINKAQVSKLFLKKVTKWENGKKVLPVDLLEKSPIRQNFSKEILGKKVSAIKAYWQKLIFSGRGVPPPEKATEKAVLKYVQEHDGAIGYVSRNIKVNRVKVLKIIY